MKNFLKLTLSFLLVLQISQSFSHDLKGAIASEDRTPKNVQEIHSEILMKLYHSSA